MAQVSGFLLIDKPEGISSFGVISRLRKITGIKAIGHTGTLDPFATGLLICCLGACTRLAQYIESESKVYEAVCRFGSETDTGDTEGEITQTAPLPQILPEHLELTEAVIALRSLPVPAFSAVKIAGKRAYQYAREGITPEIPDKETQISSFEILGLDPEGMRYRCRVSKGTYIRSLSQWLAKYCGTLGNTIELRRIGIGSLSIDQAVRLDDLSQDNWQTYLHKAGALLSGQASLTLAASQLTDLHHGRSIDFPGEDSDSLFVFSDTGGLVSICSLKSGILKPKQNFPDV